MHDLTLFTLTGEVKVKLFTITFFIYIHGFSQQYQK